LIRNAVDMKSENKAHCVAKIHKIATPENRRDQFMAEYETLKSIQHPNVVQLLNVYLRFLIFVQKTHITTCFHVENRKLIIYLCTGKIF